MLNFNPKRKSNARPHRPTRLLTSISKRFGRKSSQQKSDHEPKTKDAAFNEQQEQKITKDVATQTDEFAGANPLTVPGDTRMLWASWVREMKSSNNVDVLKKSRKPIDVCGSSRLVMSDRDFESIRTNGAQFGRNYVDYARS